MSYSPQERQNIVDAHLANRHLSCRALAELLGYGGSTIRTVINAYYSGDETLGARTAGSRAARKDAILHLHAEHPEHNCSQLARELGVSYIEVQRVLTSIGEYKRVYKPYKRHLQKHLSDKEERL